VTLPVSGDEFRIEIQTGLMVLQARDYKCSSSIRSDILQIKNLDILAQRCYQMLTFTQSSLPINFQHNLNLPETAMKQRHPKVLDMTPPRDLYALSEAFSFGR